MTEAIEDSYTPRIIHKGLIPAKWLSTGVRDNVSGRYGLTLGLDNGTVLRFVLDAESARVIGETFAPGYFDRDWSLTHSDSESGSPSVEGSTPPGQGV